MIMDQFRTHWPLNMSFTTCDIRMAEQRLLQSKMFRFKCLRLLCGVRLSDLERRSGAGRQRGALPEGFFDYLICRKDDVLLAIHRTDRGPWYGKFLYVDGIPVVEATSEQLARGEVDEVLTALEKVLRETAPPAWRCRLQPCPAQYTGAMLRGMLLEKQSGGIAPTEYGICNGLVRGEWDGKTAALCAPDTARRIPELLEKQRVPEPGTATKIPFETRLRLYRSGLSSNPHASGQLVQAVMEMPLDEYMKGFPTELEELQEALPGRCGTYGETALELYKMLHSENNGAYGRAVDLMRNLAAPALGDDKVLGAARLEPNARALERVPELVQRYRPKRETGRVIRSFQDCVQGARQTVRPDIYLAGCPQATFFQGVGVLAGSQYPWWLSGMLCSHLHLPGRFRYVDLLSLAEDKVLEGNTWSTNMGIWLYYLLLIEPYCLIYEANQTNSSNPKPKNETEVKTA